MLRQTIIVEIYGLLDKPPIITKEDFVLDVDEYKEVDQVHIKYSLGNGEEYKAQIPFVRSAKQNDFLIKTSFNPGELANQEQGLVIGYRRLLESIDSWAIRLSEDVKNYPEMRILLDQADKISQIEDKLNELYENYSEQEDKKTWEEKLNKLEKELINRIEKLEKDEKKKEERIAQLEFEFQLLNEKLQSSNFKNFARAFAGRIVRIMCDPKTGYAIENTEKLLSLVKGD